MQNIEVSIVIPTYNRKNSLKKTLISLFEQTYPKDKFEIIVCDDINNNDGTDEMIQELMLDAQYNLRYFKVKSEIKGPANARNTGIINSMGSIIGFTDDDCIVSKNWIEVALKCFKEQKDICGIYGTVVTVGNCKADMFKISRRVDVSEDDGSYVTPNIFYNKEVLLKVGCFDVGQRYLEDIELGWRVEKVGKIIFNPKLLVNHKILCISWKEYLKRMKIVEYWVLMYSKHPDHMKKDKLMFNHIYNKRVFYIIFIISSIIFYPLQHDLAFLFLSGAIAAYLWAHVLIDTRLIKYPARIVLFPRYFVPDLIRFIYSIKASIKTKCLVLF